ncbi:conditioned medium-induced protein 4 [Halococcus sp. AFM35]|uniref:conditioned medium-induced protein 4 n=1 Tax=Halococcus sp. AFM35 TaxID=3421653 RepID=UPI003EB88A36
MDEKTESLRDIFMDVTDESTVTERQEDTRGSLAREGTPEERTEEVIEALDDRYGLSTDLAVDRLVDLVAAFYDEEGDAAIADALDESPETVERARLDLHLVRESDADAPIELSALRERLNDADTATVAADLDVAESTVETNRRVAETQAARRAVGDRFRDAFDEIYLDADLTSHTDDVTRDGLDEATEGMENELSL